MSEYFKTASERFLDSIAPGESPENVARRLFEVQAEFGGKDSPEYRHLVHDAADHLGLDARSRIYFDAVADHGEAKFNEGPTGLESPHREIRRAARAVTAKTE